MLTLTRMTRRLRYGAPVIVVSGLPRSGTSMVMNMLEAGGLQILTDGVRKADNSNLRGYYELEAVKRLASDGDTSWLTAARGRAVKIISYLLFSLPPTYDYRIVFMRRDLPEVIASQNKMLKERGEAPDHIPDDTVRQIYERHLEKVAAFLSSRACFSTMAVNYIDVMTRPTEEARRISDFVDQKLDVGRMAAVVDAKLYRSRVS